MSYGHPTTMRYSRTMRQSGTEYANAIERHRSNDVGGVTIVLICGVLLAITIVARWLA